MANGFYKSDVVVLKSGRPPMTVDEVPGDAKSSYTSIPRDDYVCRWFKGAEASRGEFAEHLPTKFVPPAKK